MSMFDNYDNLSPDYIPDNTSPKPSDRYSTTDVVPRPAYNIKGNFIGYEWNYGDTFELKLTIAETIHVATNSIIYHLTTQCPSTSTVGRPGQQAYNVADVKSWTCVGHSDGLYIWVEDDVVTYLEEGDTELTLLPDMKGRTLQLDVYNFRWELFHSFSSVGTPELVCLMDNVTSEKFKPGVYYTTLKVLDGESTMLKDKYMFIVK